MVICNSKKSPFPSAFGQTLPNLTLIQLFNLTLPLTSCILAKSGQARRGEAFRTPPGSKDSNGKEESSGAAGSLSGHFLFTSRLGYNLPMTSSNWIKISIAAIIGIALGLIYGWAIQPVEYTDVTPNILRADYRADYVLMVAEAHQSEHDPETSARRLAILGSEPPAQIVASALDYATKNNFSQNEILLLQGLLTAMQTYQPEAVNPP